MKRERREELVITLAAKDLDHLIRAALIDDWNKAHARGYRDEPTIFYRATSDGQGTAEIVFSQSIEIGEP